MSATTPAKREPKNSGGGDYRAKPWGIIVAGGAIFVTAWLIWTFWFAAPV